MPSDWKAEFERIFRDNLVGGASVSVWQHGLEVLTLHEGWPEDALVPVFSATKPASALCLLMALHNAGALADIDWALQKLRAEGLRMPGAICGLWGVCGAVTSVGAALAIWEGTGPLSADGTWGQHMTCTAAALETMAATRGPRCCKRDGFIALEAAVEWLRTNRGLELGCTKPVCGFFAKNPDCIGNKCPYYPVK